MVNLRTARLQLERMQACGRMSKERAISDGEGQEAGEKKKNEEEEVVEVDEARQEPEKEAGGKNGGGSGSSSNGSSGGSGDGNEAAVKCSNIQLSGKHSLGLAITNSLGEERIDTINSAADAKGDEDDEGGEGTENRSQMNSQAGSPSPPGSRGRSGSGCQSAVQFYFAQPYEDLAVNVTRVAQLYGIARSTVCNSNNVAPNVSRLTQDSYLST